MQTGKRVMRPCTCESRYQECNCEWLRQDRPTLFGWFWFGLVFVTSPSRDNRLPGYIHIPLMVLTVSVLIVGLRYLFGG